jgi:hypothetical protein
MTTGSLNEAQTHLWGYWDVYVDIKSRTVEAVENRQAMFTANVVNFVNGKPGNLGFHINSTPIGPDYVDVDIDVTITHPFPGLPQYNGYDVRGVFMGDGSANLGYNPSLFYPVLGTDQYMLADPADGFGGPDGYTRWYNRTEFSGGGMALFQYVPGKMASPGFAGTSTLNPYKYFADGLGANDALWTWLCGHPGQHGVFSSGTSNTRNYYLRFPNPKGVKCGYAILANWAGTEPGMHPSNAPEAMACSVIDNSTLYYVDPAHQAGSLILDISVWDWDSKVSGGVMDDYRIFIESTVLSGLHMLNTAEMTPIAGGEDYSTYHVEISADNIGGVEGNEYWVIVEQKGFDYSNQFGVSNLADGDPLAALFRYDLAVSSSPVNQNPICDLAIDPSTPVPAEDFSPVAVTFDASGSHDPDGDTLTFAWDFDGDGIYGETSDDAYTGPPAKPTHGYFSNYVGKAQVKVSDGKGGQSTCSVNVQVTTHQSKNIPLRSGVDAIDLGVDPLNGDLWIGYSDRQAWKYTLAGWYQDGVNKYSAGDPDYTIRFMDTAKGGFIHFLVVHSYLPERELIYDSDGNLLMVNSWGGVENHFADCTNFGMSGPHANDLIMFVGYPSPPYTYWVNMIWGFRAPLYKFTPDYLPYYTETDLYPPVTGIDNVYPDYVKGMDTGVEGTNIWFLEAPDYYCAAFRLAPGPSSYMYTLDYNDLYFGTGSEETGDSGWTANACDLARDSDGRLHVLDVVSGQPVIKVFIGSSTGGTSVGHYGDSATISGAPIALDGDDFDGKMFVLHGDSTNGFKLSIFMPSEFPG